MRIKAPKKKTHASAVVLAEVSKVWAEIQPALESNYPEFFGRTFQVSLNGRLRTTAGQVPFPCGTKSGDVLNMELNPKILGEYPHAIREVFIHELAHIIEVFYTGDTNHSPSFVRIMTNLGCKPEHATKIELKPTEAQAAAQAARIEKLVKQYNFIGR